MRKVRKEERNNGRYCVEFGAARLPGNFITARVASFGRAGVARRASSSFKAAAFLHLMPPPRGHRCSELCGGEIQSPIYVANNEREDKTPLTS